MRTVRPLTIGAALAIGAATLGAQQVTSTNCTPMGSTVAPVVDSSAHPVRVNVGGGSTAITDSTVNLAQSKKTRTANKPVDSTSTARIDIPGPNSERRAVKANVGGGSTPITRVNNANGKGIQVDRSGNCATMATASPAPTPTSTTTSTISTSTSTTEPVVTVDSIKSHTSSTYTPGTRIVTDSSHATASKSHAKKKSTKHKSTKVASPTKKTGH